MEFPQPPMWIMLLGHNFSADPKFSHAIDEHNEKSDGDDAGNEDSEEEQIVHSHCVGHAEWLL